MILAFMIGVSIGVLIFGLLIAANRRDVVRCPLCLQPLYEGEDLSLVKPYWHQRCWESRDAILDRRAEG